MSLLQDLRLALRVLRRRPIWAGVVILSLAVALSGSTVAIGLMDHVFVRPLSYGGGRELLTAYWMNPGGRTKAVSLPHFLQIRDGLAPRGVDLAAFTRVWVVVGGADQTTRAVGEIVSGNYFRALGQAPFLGRLLQPEDDRPGAADHVVVLAHDFWLGMFGGDPDVVGRDLRLNTHAYVVVGVAPPGFVGASHSRARFWATLAERPLLMPTGDPDYDLEAAEWTAWLQIVGAVDAGVSMEELQDRTTALVTGFGKVPFDGTEMQTGAAAGWNFRLLPSNYLHLWPEYREPIFRYLAVLALLAFAVMLAAAANLISLLAVRQSERSGELSVRRALGARSWDLARHAFAEAFVLAGVAAIAGLAFVQVAIRYTGSLPLPVRWTFQLQFDARIVSIHLLTALAIGLLAGMFSAFSASRGKVQPLIGWRGGVPNGGRLQRWLVPAQVGFAVVLLVGTGLLIESVIRLRAVDPGFDPAGAVVAQLPVLGLGYTNPQAQDKYASLEAALTRAPGVEGVGLIWNPPLGRMRPQRYSVRIVGHPEGSMVTSFTIASPGYFDAVGLPVLTGRGLAEFDVAESEPVVVVNTTFATRFLGAEPIGAQINLQYFDETRTVVGVVADLRYRSLLETPDPIVYLPLRQEFRPEMHVLLRGSATPEALLATLRTVVSEQAPNIAIESAMTLEDQVDASLAEWYGLLWFGVVGTVGVLLLVIAGTFGLVAYWFEIRRYEMGIRSALGASPRHILETGLRKGLAFGATGSSVGAGLSLMMGPALASVVEAVSPYDPFILAAAVVTLVAMCALVAATAARSAAHTDPMELLRN